MAARKVSIYFYDRCEAVLRDGESISARVYQVIDRYLEAVRLDGPEIRGLFTDKEWRQLLGVANELAQQSELGTPAIAVEPSLKRSLAGNPKLLEKVANLTHASQFVLLELLEAEVPEARVGGKGGRTKGS